MVLPGSGSWCFHDDTQKEENGLNLETQPKPGYQGRVPAGGLWHFCCKPGVHSGHDGVLSSLEGRGQLLVPDGTWPVSSHLKLDSSQSGLGLPWESVSFTTRRAAMS